jgi:2-methylcitrate dehydratase PrpD
MARALGSAIGASESNIISTVASLRTLVRLASESVQPTSLDNARGRVLDFCALCLHARTRPEVSLLRKHAAGGPGESTIAGGGRTGAAQAALANGAAAHADGLDDFHPPTAVHPLVTVVPAAVAAAERSGATGLRLLRAIVAGYEVACRLGRAPDATLHHRGFHPTAVFGTLGAAAAAAIALDLDEDGVAHAVAIAATRAGGLFHFAPDGWTKALQAGWAAAAGVDAAVLASSGFHGALTILEGGRGLFEAFAGAGAFDLSRALDPQAAPAIDEVAYKPYAHSTDLHEAVDAALDGLRETGWRAADLDRVEVVLPSVAWKRTADPQNAKRRPRTGRDAQQSLHYALAVALVHAPEQGRLDTFAEFFAPERLDEGAVLALADRIEARTISGDAAPATTVTLRARSGEARTIVAGPHRGSAARPFPWDDLLARFAHLSGRSPAAGDSIAGLADHPAIGAVSALLTGHSST